MTMIWKHLCPSAKHWSRCIIHAHRENTALTDSLDSCLRAVHVSGTSLGQCCKWLPVHLLRFRSAGEGLSSLHVNNVILGFLSAPAPWKNPGCFDVCQKTNPPFALSPASQYMQKKNSLYSQLKDETVWRMEHFNSYVNEKFTKTNSLPKDWVFTVFTVSASECMVWVCLIRVTGVGRKTFSSVESLRKCMHRVKRYWWSHGNHLPADDKHRNQDTQSLILVVNKMGKLLIKRLWMYVLA